MGRNQPQLLRRWRMEFKRRLAHAVAASITVLVLGLGAAAPASAEPNPNASVAGVASSYYAHQQSRDELSQTLLIVRKAGGDQQELKGSFTDLLVSSGVCPPSVCSIDE
jgi:hypothetical protein